MVPNITENTYSEFEKKMLRKLFGPKGVNVIEGMEQIA
jgi:hypothetical protein